MSNEEEDSCLQDVPPAKKIKFGQLHNDEAGVGTKEEIVVDYTGDVTETDDRDFLVGGDNYTNYVPPEELERLKEFKVLDEVNSNDEDSNGENSNSSDGQSDVVPEDEIEKMLEEDLPDDFKGAPKPKEKPYVTRQKIVLEEKGTNHFSVLPLDWMIVRHYSGMPVYMHRSSRVCTLAKPYFLGKGNSRRHDIPISAIPCLSYRKALEEEEKQREIDKKIQEQKKRGMWLPKNKTNITPIANTVNTAAKEDKQSGPDLFKCPYNPLQHNNQSTSNDPKNTDTGTAEKDEEKLNAKELPKTDVAGNESLNDKIDNSQNVEPSEENVDDIPLSRRPVVLPDGAVMSPPRVESVNTSWTTQNLTHDQVNDYCSKLFKFKTVNIMHFKRWADRRKYTKARKTLQYPKLPDGTKLIAVPAQPAAAGDAGGKGAKRDWMMNMNGRSYLSVFHEYVRRALQKQPVYEFKQLENASSPYQATVQIGGMQYGVGRGTSKRQAKAAAARASIRILIPEMRAEMDAGDAPRDQDEPDFSFFNEVGIEDPRVPEFCAATCEPSPHATLRTCLLRNFGASDRHIQTEMKKLEYQKIELTMRVGKHSATVVCKNKKTAKQRASQAILQALHPHIRSWGSLLRLYGSRSVKSCKERKVEEQQITLLQDKAQAHAPNVAVLAKLRQEMRKLRARDAAVVPIGTLVLRDHLPSHSGSNLNNVDL